MASLPQRAALALAALFLRTTPGDFAPNIRMGRGEARMRDIEETNVLRVFENCGVGGFLATSNQA